MQNPEIYNPTQVDINNAESMMTDEQQRSSEIRAEYYEQEQPPWKDFTDKIDENFVRKRPSPEVIKTMNKSLEELGQAFEGSDLNWHLDGALNISLMNGAGENPEKYIGEHKDVDISVEKDELEAMEAQLLKNGYGLFLSRTEDKTKNKIMRRVSYGDFAGSDAEHVNTLEYVVKLSDQELESALRNIDQNCLQFDAMDDERRQKAKVDIERLISKLKDPEIKRRIFEASKEISKLQSDVIELIK